MANGITTALEGAAKKLGHSLGEDLGQSFHRLLHDTDDKVTQNVAAHVEHDGKAAKDLEAAAEHGDETPTVHGDDGATPTPVSSGGGGSSVARPPTVGSGAADPPGTHRDAGGRLRGADNRFVTDPAKTDRQKIDFPADRTGTKRRRDVSDEAGPALKATVTSRTAAANAKASAGKQVDELAGKLGVDPKKLTGSDRQATLRDLRGKGASRQDVAAAKRAGDDYRAANLDLHRQSEKLGMQAGEGVLKQDGYQQISGSSDRAGRPGEADLIGVNHDGSAIKVVEAKGGTADLGSGRYLHDHTPPGRAEQGSPEYLDDLLKRDPEFSTYLAANPQFAQQFAAGNVRVDYTVVSASGAGTVTETPLVSR